MKLSLVKNHITTEANLIEFEILYFLISLKVEMQLKSQSGIIKHNSVTGLHK